MIGAVELGGTKINVACGSGPGAIRAETKIPTTTPDETLRSVIAFLRAQPAMAAIGIGSFGPVCLDRADAKWGFITDTTKAGWSQTPIATVLGEALGLPVAFDTDVNAAAIGEHRWGALSNQPVGVYITVGTGIGGGVVIDGRPHHGRLHPEMGHIHVRRSEGDSFPGICPFHGDCAEGLTSGPAIANRFGKSLSEIDPADPRRAFVFDALGQALANIVLTLSPHRIVVGGGVAKAPGFHAELTARLSHWLGDYVALPDDYVVPPALGDEAGILGAIALASDLAVGG